VGDETNGRLRSAPRALGLLPAGCSAPPPAHQIDIGSRLEERIGRGLDAIHARDRIEDDALLLAGVIRDNLPQTDFAKRALRTLLGPANRRVVNRVAVLGQLHDYTKPDGSPENSLSDLVEEEVRTARGGFGRVEIFVA
jgi:hypothetical protein